MINKAEHVMECLETVHQGCALASVKGPNGSTLTFYSINGGDVRIVQHYKDGGVEVYKPVTASGKMDDLIAALGA